MEMDGERVVPDRIYYTSLLFGLIFAAVFGYFLHSGQLLIAAAWILLAALQMYVYTTKSHEEINRLRSTISGLKEEQYVGTIDVLQKAKNNGEIELEVKSQ